LIWVKFTFTKGVEVHVYINTKNDFSIHN